MKEHLIILYIYIFYFSFLFTGLMAWGNQCQRQSEGKQFVRKLASAKLPHKFSLIYCLSFLVCGYMWVQAGYFEIKDLGVETIERHK